MANQCRSVCACLITIILLTPVQADITLSYTYPLDNGQEIQLITRDDRATMQTPIGSKVGRILFDRVNNRIFLIIDSEQTCFDLDVMINSLGRLTPMLAGVLSNLPEALISQLESVQGPTAKAVEVIPTEHMDEVQGFDCQVSRFRWPHVEAEVCLAPPQTLGISVDDFVLLRQMAARQAASVQWAIAALGFQAPDFRLDVFDQVPLRFRQVGGSRAGSTVEFRAIRLDSDPALVFIPAYCQ